MRCIKTPLILTAELIPAGLRGKSLQKRLSSSVWTRLRNHRIKQADSKCEICGSSDEPLHAHEVWEYIDTANVPWLDATSVERAIANYKAEKQKKAEQVGAVFRRLDPDYGRVLKNKTTSHTFIPKLAVLSGIRILCRLCHLCKHYQCYWKSPRQIFGGAYDIMCHWCKINRRFQKEFIEYYRNKLLEIEDQLIIKIEYSGYEKLPNFRTIEEWEEDQKDEAELYDENPDFYQYPPIWSGP